MRLRAPEIPWLTDKVEAAFTKHAVTLFPKEPRPFIKPPEKKKRKKKIVLDDIEQLQQGLVEVSLPLRGKEKLQKLNSTLITEEPA